MFLPTGNNAKTWTKVKIMATTRKQIQPMIRQYILDCIDEGLENEDLTTDQEKIKYLQDRFNSEYGWMIQRVGKINACREWLLGLALNVDYSYYNIEQRLKLWGILDGTESEKKLDAELDRYWDRLGEAVRYMIDRDHK